jgi:hypothetical protein
VVSSTGAELTGVYPLNAAKRGDNVAMRPFVEEAPHEFPEPHDWWPTAGVHGAT